MSNQDKELTDKELEAAAGGAGGVLRGRVAPQQAPQGTAPPEPIGDTPGGPDPVLGSEEKGKQDRP